MRALSDHDENLIFAATASGVEARGGVSAAAAALGIASSTVTKYVSRAKEWRQSFIRLDLAAALDRMNGHPYILNAMSEVVLGAARPQAEVLTEAIILRIGMVLDDVVREAAQAIEDGHICEAERLAIRGRIAQAQAQLTRLDRVVVSAWS